MKLSDSIILGSTTCKLKVGDLNVCAVGAAANAVGLPLMKNSRDFSRLEAVYNYWPWLYGDNSSGLRHMGEIAYLFDGQVCRGEMTLEQLADYVRTIEPECGECNQFKCTCKTVIEKEENVYGNVSK